MYSEEKTKYPVDKNPQWSRSKKIEALMGIAETIARKYSASYFSRASIRGFSSHLIEPDDVKSIAALGIIDAVDTYDNKHGSRLTTWATMKAKNAVLEAMRNVHQTRRKNSLSSIPFSQVHYAMEGDDDFAQHISDTLMDQGQNLECSALKTIEEEVLLNATDILPSRENLVIQLRYFGENTFKEIAQKMNISESRANQIHVRAIKRLRKDETLQGSGTFKSYIYDREFMSVVS